MTRSDWLEYAVSASMVVAFLLLAAVTGWTYAETLLFLAIACFVPLILLLALFVVAVILDKFQAVHPSDTKQRRRERKRS